MKQLIQNDKPRYLIFLSMLAISLWLICLVTQSRLTMLGSGYVSTAVLPYPFLCITLDLIAELYGYKVARKVLWSAFILLFIFSFTIYCFNKLPAPDFWDGYTKAFDTTVSPMIRTVIFGSVGVVIGQYINIYVFSKLRVVFSGGFFGARTIISTFIGDTLTFAIALFGDFVGSINIHSIFVLVIDELIIMYLMAIILSIPMSIVARRLKQIEPQFNYSVNFNPFK